MYASPVPGGHEGRSNLLRYRGAALETVAGCVTFITRFRLPFEVDGDLRLYFNRHPVFYPRLITPFFNRFQHRAT